MEYNQLVTSLRGFSNPLSTRCGVEENPCQMILNLEDDHARLTEIYKGTLQKAENHVSTHLPLTIIKATAIIGGCTTALFFPVFFIETVVCVMAIGMTLLISGIGGIFAGNTIVKDEALPKLTHSFKTEVNWVHSVYDKVDSAITEIPLLEQATTKPQLLMLKAHFDEVLLDDKRMELKRLGTSLRGS